MPGSFPGPLPRPFAAGVCAGAEGTWGELFSGGVTCSRGAFSGSSALPGAHVLWRVAGVALPSHGCWGSFLGGRPPRAQPLHPEVPLAPPGSLPTLGSASPPRVPSPLRGSLPTLGSASPPRGSLGTPGFPPHPGLSLSTSGSLSTPGFPPLPTPGPPPSRGSVPRTQAGFGVWSPCSPPHQRAR